MIIRRRSVILSAPLLCRKKMRDLLPLSELPVNYRRGQQQPSSRGTQPTTTTNGTHGDISDLSASNYGINGIGQRYERQGSAWTPIEEMTGLCSESSGSHRRTRQVDLATIGRTCCSFASRHSQQACSVIAGQNLMAGDHFDASSDPPSHEEPREVRAVGGSRPFVGVQFQCCGAYSRIFLNPPETAFAGYCPRCGRRVEFPVSETGSNDRFFTVY